MAKVRKSKVRSPGARGKPVTITRRFLEALTGTKQDAYYRVLDALALARRDKQSPTKAARKSGTTLQTMRKYAGSALQERSGRVYVTASDRLPRRMRVFTTHGEQVVQTTSSRKASLIADHNNAIRAYVLTRDASELKQFEGKTIRSGGKVYTFGTDPRTLDRHIRAGAAHFVDIYARGAST
jgi:hypothetical protein